MRRVGIAVGVLGALLLGIVAAGWLLPREWRVARTEVVDAPPELVFWAVSTVEGWESWASYADEDPTFEVRPTKTPQEGVGAVYAWNSEQYGSGRLEITETAPHDRVRYTLDVGIDGFLLQGEMALVPVAAGTELTWTETGDLGANPLVRWMAFLSKGMVEEDFRVGFERLHRAVAAEQERREARALEEQEAMWEKLRALGPEPDDAVEEVLSVALESVEAEEREALRRLVLSRIHDGVESEELPPADPETAAWVERHLTGDGEPEAATR